MEKLNKKLKTVVLAFCVVYTFLGIFSQIIGAAWAIEEWEFRSILSRVVKDTISSKISAYDYDFKREVKKVVEDNCSVDEESISCY